MFVVVVCEFDAMKTLWFLPILDFPGRLRKGQTRISNPIVRVCCRVFVLGCQMSRISPMVNACTRAVKTVLLEQLHVVNSSPHSFSFYLTNMKVLNFTMKLFEISRLVSSDEAVKITNEQFEFQNVCRDSNLGSLRHREESEQGEQAEREKWDGGNTKGREMLR
jgi:hypothetical protein